MTTSPTLTPATDADDRQRYDREAYEAARLPAARAVADLLAVLTRPSAAADVARAARAAHTAAGSLWETAARLAE